MSQRGVPITMLKIASLGGAARELAESVGTAARLTGRAAKGAFHLSGDIGEALASGLQVDPRIGRATGQIAAGGGAVYGAKRGKDKIDQYKYMHNFPVM